MIRRPDALGPGTIRLPLSDGFDSFSRDAGFFFVPVTPGRIVDYVLYQRETAVTVSLWNSVVGWTIVVMS